jgi:hypothetical protein
MENSGSVVTLGIAAVFVILIIWLLILRSSRRVNLTRTPDGEKPKWMSTTPPPETTAATRADGEGMALYDHDKEENEAAPFAEQIEDILRSQMSADPDLRSYEVDFGTGADGRLEIKVGDKLYTDIEQIPDRHLRAAINHAVATYNQRYKGKRASQ